MIILKFNPISRIFSEFIRYCAVGGIAFLVDFSTLFILTEYLGINYLICVMIGFLAGLIINYIMSTSWVFRASKCQGLRPFLIFSIIGMTGLIITELLMWLGVSIFHINYILVKLGVTAFVLIWNYTARKIIVFGNRSTKFSLESNNIIETK